MIIYLAMIEDEQERSKFEHLYYKYRQVMFYVANGILKDEHLAEDTVHQAFIKLVDHLEKIEDVESHKTKGFCVIIVKHIAIDLLRQKKKETLGMDIEYEQTSKERVEEVVINKNQAQLLTDKIRTLPEHYQSVIFLKYNYGYSDFEIANLLSIEPSNVRKRLERARKKLKLLLKEGDE